EHADEGVFLSRLGSGGVGDRSAHAYPGHGSDDLGTGRSVARAVREGDAQAAPLTGSPPESRGARAGDEPPRAQLRSVPGPRARALRPSGARDFLEDGAFRERRAAQRRLTRAHRVDYPRTRRRAVGCADPDYRELTADGVTFGRVLAWTPSTRKHDPSAR